jgi:hypothetical protein
MRLEDLNAMITAAAVDMPPPPLLQPENDLKPDPSRLRARLDYLELRVDTLEKWASAMNPTFWNYKSHEERTGHDKPGSTGCSCR